MVRLTGETVTGEWVTDTGATITGRHYTVKGLADLLGTSDKNIRYHIAAGHIATHKVGQTRLIPAVEARRIAREYQPNKSWPTTTKDPLNATRKPRAK